MLNLKTKFDVFWDCTSASNYDESLKVELTHRPEVLALFLKKSAKYFNLSDFCPHLLKGNDIKTI